MKKYCITGLERIMLFMFAILLSLSAIAKGEIWPESEWAEITPEGTGMDEPKLIQAREYSLGGNGSGLIIRGGRKVK